MTQTTRKTIHAGTFKPPTLGHLNLIERGLKLFDQLTVAVATNLSKQPILSSLERVTLLQELLKPYPTVEVTTFEGLLVHFAEQKKIDTLLRGIRNIGDYEYESQMALVNKALSPKIETVFMMTEGQYSHLSSSFIREVIAFGGSGKGMIPPAVEAKLKEKLGRAQ